MKKTIVHVDEYDNVIGGITRTDAHSQKRLLHREVDIFLVNDYGLLLIKRQDSKKWCHVGGHVDYNSKSDTAEQWITAASREFKEETGFKISNTYFKEIGHYIRRIEPPLKINHRFVRVFLSRKNVRIEDFKRERKEVAEIKYFSRTDLDAMIYNPEQIMGATRYILTELETHPSLYTLIS